MADQEFLASFGIEIDESGVMRLQAALEENRTLAEELASSFDNARTSVQAFFRELDEIALPGTVVSFDASSQTRQSCTPITRFSNSVRKALNSTKPSMN